MENKNQRCLHTFNALAELLMYGDIIDGHCHSYTECERTLNLINCITERMKKLIEIMEECS